MNKSQIKKAERKIISIKEHQYAPEHRMAYPDAMALVRKFRREAQYAMGQHVLEQVCQQVKIVPEPQLYLMNIYLDSMNIDGAQTLVDSLLKKFPRETSVLTNCATFYVKIYDTESALALLERATAVDPGNDKIHVVRARVYRSMGNSAGAQECYHAALKLNSKNVTAMSGVITPSDNPMEQPQVKAIITALEKDQLPDIAIAELHFALATAFRRADKATHFHHLHEANRIVRDLRPYNAKRECERVDEIIRDFAPEHANLSGFASQQSLAPIFIAAMPRSGTTMLEQMLDCHSNIHAIGESGAFANALRRAGKSSASSSIFDDVSTAEELCSLIDQISIGFQENYFVKSAKSHRLIDKSMGTVYEIGNILSVFPHARIIDMRRHPLDLIYSCYQQFFANAHNYAFDLRLLAQRYTDYRRMMDYWCGRYPDRIFPVSYETLVESPEPVLRSILDFCGLDWEPSCLGFHEKSGTVVNTASLEQVRKPLYKSSVYQWERVVRYLEPAIDELGKLTDYTPVRI